jgi:hypothetical protein
MEVRKRTEDWRDVVIRHSGLKGDWGFVVRERWS